MTLCISGESPGCAATGSNARDVAVMADVGRGTALRIASVAVAESLASVEEEAFPVTVAT